MISCCVVGGGEANSLDGVMMLPSLCCLSGALLKAVLMSPVILLTSFPSEYIGGDDGEDGEVSPPK